MFTGIIEETGKITGIQRGRKSSVLTIGGQKIFDDLKLGDSVAVNGVCLTVTHLEKGWFQVDVMSETLNRTSLGSLKTGSLVNLERALPANGRLGGHIVSGHIDGTGTIAGIEKDDNAIWFTIKTSPQITRYIIMKGSIAIDGISLTVAGIEDDVFQVSVIPHTAAHTTLAMKSVGDTVNLENDLVGKYIEKLIKTDGSSGSSQKAGSRITEEFLARNGF